MNVLSVCSGIGAPEAAWTPLGWQFVACSEIEPFPSAVLNHRYPDVPNLGDMTEFKEWPGACRCLSAGFDESLVATGLPLNGDCISRRSDVHAVEGPSSRGGNSSKGGFCEKCGGPDVDVLVGGTPCQSFSVAGLRKGLADPRGNLALVYLAIADRYRPDWLVWENVTGVLSSSAGRDFGAFLGGLGEIGYGFAYRVLDAQYFGLAQRRKRVFVVGYLGDWRRAAAVLFERESLQGHPAPSREAGEVAAGSVEAGVGNSVTHALTGEGFDASEDGTGRSDAESETFVVPVAVSLRGRDGGATAELTPSAHPALRASQGGGDKPHILAFNARQDPTHGDVTDALGTKDTGHGILSNAAVRRLMPVECERLQGFPDGYTDVVYRKKPATDGPRYKALGNSMAVPVVRWIGERIEMVEALMVARRLR